MKKLLYLLVIAVVIAAVTLPAFAQDKSKEKEMTAHKDACAIMKDLKLTEKQQAEIDKITKSCMVSHKDYHAKLAKLGEKKSKLMAAEKPDKDAIGKIIDETAKISAAVKKICVDCKLKIRALLTPEQLKKFNEIKEKCCSHESTCTHKACCTHHHDKKEVKKTEEKSKGCTSKTAAGCSQDCIHK